MTLLSIIIPTLCAALWFAVGFYAAKKYYQSEKSKHKTLTECIDSIIKITDSTDALVILRNKFEFERGDELYRSWRYRTIYDQELDGYSYLSQAFLCLLPLFDTPENEAIQLQYLTSIEAVSTYSQSEIEEFIGIVQSSANLSIEHKAELIDRLLDLSNLYNHNRK